MGKIISGDTASNRRSFLRGGVALTGVAAAAAAETHSTRWRSMHHPTAS